MVMHPSMLILVNTDPAFDASLAITAADAATITVNVGASPAGQQYTHTFVSALPNAVTSAGSVDCVHDITDILQALVFHLKYGGNSRVVDAAQFYVNASNALLHVASQATETVYAMNEAKKIMFDVMRNVPTLITLVTTFATITRVLPKIMITIHTEIVVVTIPQWSKSLLVLLMLTLFSSC